MVKFKVKIGSCPVQIDDFGSKVERTCDGALYLYPNTVHSVSDSEFGWIEKKHPAVFKSLFVLPLPKKLSVAKIKKDEFPNAKELPTTDYSTKEEKTEDGKDEKAESGTKRKRGKKIY